MARLRDGRGAEIGVSKGNFSDHILRHWRGRELMSIDPWFDAEDTYERCCTRLAAHDARSTVWKLTSEEGDDILGSPSQMRRAEKPNPLGWIVCG